MSKININFNDTPYSVPESSLSTATESLKSHLSTVMNGSGSVIKLDGVSYNVDSSKLATATNDFVSHLGTISGSGSKVTVGGVNYSIDSVKISGAVSDLETVLGNLNNPSIDDNIIMLLSSDNLILVDSNGVYLTVKEND